MSKKAGNQQKFGRNAKWCATYTMNGTRLKNKKKKIRRHIKNYPEDAQAVRALGKL